MQTVDIMGHKVVYTATIWNKFYLFAYDVEHELYMIKVNEDGSIDIL